MSIAAIAGRIGQVGTIQLGELVVEVEVLDLKQSYGHNRVLVQPVAGCGVTWVNLASVTFKDETDGR